jgi:hypothetical protein
LISQVVSFTIRIREVATTDALRRPRSSTPVSPKTSPGPSVASRRPSWRTSAVPSSMAISSVE